MYTVLSSLVAPKKPRDMMLDAIADRLKRHFNPPPLEISESFHFGKRDQKPGEAINDYVLALKRLSVHCNFGDYLNRALRDRFVCGLRDTRIQNKLLNTDNLTFDGACRVASAMEMASRQAQEMNTVSSVHKLSGKSVDKQKSENPCVLFPLL